MAPDDKVCSVFWKQFNGRVGNVRTIHLTPNGADAASFFQRQAEMQRRRLKRQEQQHDATSSVPSARTIAVSVKGLTDRNCHFALSPDTTIAGLWKTFHEYIGFIPDRERCLVYHGQLLRHTNFTLSDYAIDYDGVGALPGTW